MTHPPPPSPIIPYTTLFRSTMAKKSSLLRMPPAALTLTSSPNTDFINLTSSTLAPDIPKPVEVLIKSGLTRSEEHTSELQSRGHLVCRLLLEKHRNIHIKTI